MSKQFKFGSHTPPPKTLANLKIGDEIVECRRDGTYIRIAKVKKNTGKAIWTGDTALQPRYQVSDGIQINGRGSARLPTQADRKKHQAEKDRARERSQEEERLKGVRSQPEYQAAKNIGYILQDESAFVDDDSYLALAKRIGLEPLLAFEKLAEAAKNVPAPTPKRRHVRSYRDVRTNHVPAAN